MKNIYGSKKIIEEYIVLLEKDICKLIRALEIYLKEFVGKIEITRKVKEIEALIVDRVLSFNYTNTYAKNYGIAKNIEYTYIHGIAKSENTLESNNMVLGINEYLVGVEKDIDTIFVVFKKYFQRIFKMTESNYFDWIDTIQEELNTAIENEIQSKGNMGTVHRKARLLDFSCSSNLYIYGHSLDTTDGDVLRKLICNDNVYTKIFFYREYEDDKRNFGKLIKNLLGVIGQDELIKRTSGEERTIEFIPQSLKD